MQPSPATGSAYWSRKGAEKMVLPLLLLLAMAASAEKGSSPPEHTSGQWLVPPIDTPSTGCPDGPVMGNGAVSVVLSGGNGSLAFHIARNDAWVPATGDISACGYNIDNAGARTLGQVALKFNGTAGFRATQQIDNGTVVTAQTTAGGGTLRSASFVARGSDVLVTEVWWDVTTPAAGPAPPPLALEVLNAQSLGGSTCVLNEQNATAMWSSRTLGHPYQNVNSTVGRRHLYKATWATAVVEPPLGPSPAPPVPPSGPPPPAPCSRFDGDCAACIAAHDNRAAWPGACLQLNISIVNMNQAHSCVPSSWWVIYNATYKNAHSCVSCANGSSNPDKSCMHIPDVPPQKVSTYQLAPGQQNKLIIATAVLSNWDPDYLPAGAAARSDTSLYPDPTVPAQQLAMRASKMVAELRSNTTKWWKTFWSKSSISLPNSPGMEQQWWGSLYILASSHRTDGSSFAVAPGIVWPITNDAPAFRGAMTMNYVSHFRPYPSVVLSQFRQDAQETLRAASPESLRNSDRALNLPQNQEALYYGIYSANHAELAGPYYNAMNQYIPRGNKDAMSFFQCPGINVSPAPSSSLFHPGHNSVYRHPLIFRHMSHSAQ